MYMVCFWGTNLRPLYRKLKSYALTSTSSSFVSRVVEFHFFCSLCFLSWFFQEVYHLRFLSHKPGLFPAGKVTSLHFTTKLRNLQCALDDVESLQVHSCVLIFSWYFSPFQCPPSARGSNGRISFLLYQIFLFRACVFSWYIVLYPQMIPL